MSIPDSGLTAAQVGLFLSEKGAVTWQEPVEGFSQDFPLLQPYIPEL